jgi:hypothetical protein
MFRTVPLSIIRSFHCTHSDGICHKVLLTACKRDQDGKSYLCFGQFLCPSSVVFHCTHSNGICHTRLLTACKRDQDGTSSICFGQFLCPSSGVFHCTHNSKPVWHIPLLCVQRKTSDDGQRNYPKHTEFHSKYKFEKLVHLVGLL